MMPFISDGCFPASLPCIIARAAVRPSEVSKSDTTDLMSGFALGSFLAASSALPLARPSLAMPIRPLGSASVTAIPASITLPSTWLHSSGAKSFLVAMDDLLSHRKKLGARLKQRADFRNRNVALAYCFRIAFAENRHPL